MFDVRPALAVGTAVLAAEGAGRLLRPRSGTTPPTERLDATSYFSMAELHRARAYRRGGTALALAGAAVKLTALARVARRPPSVLQAPRDRPVLAGALAGGALMAGSGALTLPFAALARRRALGVGLATGSWRAWGRDVALASALQGAASAGAAAGTIALQRRHGDRWWLPGSGALVAVAGGLGFVAPVLLDPLFNRFEPLGPGTTRDDVLEVVRSSGLEVGDVLVADASRRTSAANACVTGLGATRRIVLFDTLLETFDRDEVRLVVAHELAHVAHRDVPRSLAQLTLTAPVTLWASGVVARAIAPATGPMPTPAALAPLALASGIVSLATLPALTRLSRAAERRADRYALRLAGAPEAMIAFERKITLQHLADPAPRLRRLHELTATHPTTMERIAIAREAGAAA